MKNQPLKKICALGLFCMMAMALKAQSNAKPQIFQNYPAEIPCNSTVLDALFAQAENTPVNINLSANFIITGTLTGIIDNGPNLKSLIIKLSNFNNMVFGISKIRDIYTPEKYTGRIMNAQQYADYYELVLENGQYKFKKQLSDHVLTPCKQ